MTLLLASLQHTSPQKCKLTQGMENIFLIPHHKATITRKKHTCIEASLLFWTSHATHYKDIKCPRLWLGSGHVAYLREWGRTVKKFSELSWASLNYLHFIFLTFGPNPVITPGSSWEPYEVPGIKPVQAKCPTSCSYRSGPSHLCFDRQVLSNRVVSYVCNVVEYMYAYVYIHTELKNYSLLRAAKP